MFRSHKLFLPVALALVASVTQAQTTLSTCLSGCVVGMMASQEGTRYRPPSDTKWPVKYPPIIDTRDQRPVKYPPIIDGPDPRPMSGSTKGPIEVTVNYLSTTPAGVTQFPVRPGPMGTVSAKLPAPIPMSWPPANYK